LNNAHRSFEQKEHLVKTSGKYDEERAEADTIEIPNWVSELERYTDFSFQLASNQQYQELIRLGHLTAKKLLEDKEMGRIYSPRGQSRHPDKEMPLPRIEEDHVSLDFLALVSQHETSISFVHLPDKSLISYQSRFN